MEEQLNRRFWYLFLGWWTQVWRLLEI